MDIAKDWAKIMPEMGNYVVSADAAYETYTAYLATLEELGFAPYTDNSESDMDDDGVYNAVYTKANGDWVLSITFVKNEGKVYISISTVGEKGLSPYLKASEGNIALANTGGNVSFTMLEISDGNGFVFQLPDGHFIVNDGGKAVDGGRLIAYLREKAGTEPVIIDAWIFTHLHQDHSGAAAKLFEEASLRENVYVNGIYLSEPNLKVNTMDPNGNELGETIDAFKGLMTMTQQDGVSKPAVYRMHAMEILNGSAIASGYEDYNPRVYDDFLRLGERIYCIGADDNHNDRPDDVRQSDSGWAWTTIKAEKLDYETIADALLKGHFYASEGPEIYDLYVEDGKVHIKCSPADRVICTYEKRAAGAKFAEYGGELVTEVAFDAKPEYGYFRITVRDERGNVACTNAYFPEDYL